MKLLDDETYEAFIIFANIDVDCTDKVLYFGLGLMVWYRPRDV